MRSVPPGEAETRHGGPRAVYTPPAELGGRGHGPTWHRFPAWGEQAKSIRGAKENSGRDGEEPSRALEDGPRQSVRIGRGRSLMEERVARGSGGKGREKSSQQLVSMVEEKARLSGQRRLSDSSSASEVRMAPPLSHTMASGSSPPGRLHGQESEQRDDRSEGELSEEEEPTVPARVNTATAVGIVPSQPGKSITSVSLSGAVQELLGGLQWVR